MSRKAPILQKASELTAKDLRTEQEASNQFRILWLNEEIARCGSTDGRCDFFIP